MSYALIKLIEIKYFFDFEALKVEILRAGSVYQKLFNISTMKAPGGWSSLHINRIEQLNHWLLHLYVQKLMFYVEETSNKIFPSQFLSVNFLWYISSLKQTNTSKVTPWSEVSLVSSKTFSSGKSASSQHGSANEFHIRPSVQARVPAASMDQPTKVQDTQWSLLTFSAYY